jgi:mono/diheme cytochrome c family protein
MLSHPMTRTVRRTLVALPLAAAAAAGLGACGEQGIQLAKSSPYYQGATIFTEHCSGCHTLAVAGTQGSASNIRTREYKDGPNFNQRKEQVQGILYAIRNGGFSSGPMPQDIVTGQQAQQVAQFIAKFSGKDAKRPPSPSSSKPTGFPSGQGSSSQTGGGASNSAPNSQGQGSNSGG